MVTEIAVDGWNHTDEIVGYATDAAEQVDGALKATAEDASSGEE